MTVVDHGWGCRAGLGAAPGGAGRADGGAAAGCALARSSARCHPWPRARPACAAASTWCLRRRGRTTPWTLPRSYTSRCARAHTACHAPAPAPSPSPRYLRMRPTTLPPPPLPRPSPAPPPLPAAHAGH